MNSPLILGSAQTSFSFFGYWNFDVCALLITNDIVIDYYLSILLFY